MFFCKNSCVYSLGFFGVVGVSCTFFCTGQALPCILPVYLWATWLQSFVFNIQHDSYLSKKLRLLS